MRTPTQGRGAQAIGGTRREINPAETASLGAKLDVWAKNAVASIVKGLDQPPS